MLTTSNNAESMCTAQGALLASYSPSDSPKAFYQSAYATCTLASIGSCADYNTQLLADLPACSPETAASSYAIASYYAAGAQTLATEQLIHRTWNQHRESDSSRTVVAQHLPIHGILRRLVVAARCISVLLMRKLELLSAQLCSVTSATLMMLQMPPHQRLLQRLLRLLRPAMQLLPQAEPCIL